MNFGWRLFEILTARGVSMPKAFGAFHITMLALILAVTVIFCIKYKSAGEREIRGLLLGVWIAMVVGEIYHQICFAFSLSADGLVFAYPWYKFPFQFCSTPLYALPFAVFLPDGRVRDGFIAFLSSFSLFAGLAVILYPADAFVDIIGVNIQTMMHHGSQVALGILLFTRYREKMTLRRFAYAIPIFAVLLCIALIMNTVAYQLITEYAPDESFNMFFISPYFDCTLPILSDVCRALPYPAFLAIYIFGFILVSATVFNLLTGVRALYKRAVAHRSLSKIEHQNQ